MLDESNTQLRMLVENVSSIFDVIGWLANVEGSGERRARDG